MSGVDKTLTGIEQRAFAREAAKERTPKSKAPGGAITGNSNPFIIKLVAVA